jgi:hypothetical protein
MTAVTISVLPIDNGWSVHQEPGGEPLVFLSGGRAEAAARRLAKASTRSGLAAELLIKDRGGGLVGRFHYPAE